jgi:hypothetical protein
MMEAVRTSETSVDNHFTRQYIPEDNSERHTRRRENLKSHIFFIIVHSFKYSLLWMFCIFKVNVDYNALSTNVAKAPLSEYIKWALAGRKYKITNVITVLCNR